MPSFAEGLANGLMQGNQINQANDENRRKDAMQLFTLSNQSDEHQWKKEAHETEKSYLEKSTKLANSYLHQSVEVDVPSALGDGTTQKKTVIQNYTPGTNLARDMQFNGDYGMLALAHGKMTPEAMSRFQETQQKMQSTGITQALGKYAATQDPKALDPIAAQIGAEPGSLSVTSQPDPKHPNVPLMMLHYTKDGKPVKTNIEYYTMAMGAEDPFSKVADKNLSRSALQASTNASNSSSALNAEKAKTEPIQREYLRSKADALGNTKDDKTVVNSTMGGALDGKPTIMPQGSMYLQGMRGLIREGTGVNNKATQDLADKKFMEFRSIAKEQTDQFFANRVDPKNPNKKAGAPMPKDYNAKEQEILGKLVSLYVEQNPDKDELAAFGKSQKVRQQAILNRDALTGE